MEEFLRLYKQGFRTRVISKRLGLSYSPTRRIILSFDAGDFSWMEHKYHHYENTIPESRKQEIVIQCQESRLTMAELVKGTGFPESVLERWIKNYNKYGVCCRKRGRPRNDMRTKEDQTAGRRDYLLQDVLPNLGRGRTGSSKKRFYEQLANADGLESLSKIASEQRK